MFELLSLNLYELIRGRRRYLSPDLVRIYAFQLLRALAHMHSKGIFHRDIKPENILIADEYDVYTGLKLADFGSCRGIYSKQPYTEYISTRWYRAPECLLTDGYYGAAMDIWGAACVIFEISALFPLFAGRDEKDQVAKIHAVQGTPSAAVLSKLKAHATSHMDLSFPFEKGTGITTLAPHLDANLVDLLSKMLAYDSSVRLTADQALQHPYFEELRKVPIPAEVLAEMAGGGAPPATASGDTGAGSGRAVGSRSGANAARAGASAAGSGSPGEQEAAKAIDLSSSDAGSLGLPPMEKPSPAATAAAAGTGGAAATPLQQPAPRGSRNSVASMATAATEQNKAKGANATGAKQAAMRVNKPAAAGGAGAGKNGAQLRAATQLRDDDVSSWADPADNGRASGLSALAIGPAAAGLNSDANAGKQGGGAGAKAGSKVAKGPALDPEGKRVDEQEEEKADGSTAAASTGVGDGAGPNGAKKARVPAARKSEHGKDGGVGVGPQLRRNGQRPVLAADTSDSKHDHASPTGASGSPSVSSLAAAAPSPYLGTAGFRPSKPSSLASATRSSGFGGAAAPATHVNTGAGASSRAAGHARHARRSSGTNTKEAVAAAAAMGFGAATALAALGGATNGGTPSRLASGASGSSPSHAGRALGAPPQRKGNAASANPNASNFEVTLTGIGVSKLPRIPEGSPGAVSGAGVRRHAAEDKPTPAAVRAQAAAMLAASNVGSNAAITSVGGGAASRQPGQRNKDLIADARARVDYGADGAGIDAGTGGVDSSGTAVLMRNGSWRTPAGKLEGTARVRLAPVAGAGTPSAGSHGGQAAGSTSIAGGGASSAANSSQKHRSAAVSGGLADTSSTAMGSTTGSGLAPLGATSASVRSNLAPLAFKPGVLGSPASLPGAPGASAAGHGLSGVSSIDRERPRATVFDRLYAGRVPEATSAAAAAAITSQMQQSGGAGGGGGGGGAGASIRKLHPIADAAGGIAVGAAAAPDGRLSSLAERSGERGTGASSSQGLLAPVRPHGGAASVTQATTALRRDAGTGGILSPLPLAPLSSVSPNVTVGMIAGVRSGAAQHAPGPVSGGLGPARGHLRPLG